MRGQIDVGGSLVRQLLVRVPLVVEHVQLHPQVRHVALLLSVDVDDRVVNNKARISKVAQATGILEHQHKGLGRRGVVVVGDRMTAIRDLRRVAAAAAAVAATATMVAVVLVVVVVGNATLTMTLWILAG